MAEPKKWFGAIENQRLTANGKEVQGVLNFTLGDIQRLTSEIGGSGLIGKINVPVNMFEAVELTITHGALTKNLAELLNPDGVDLIFGFVYTNIDQDLKIGKEGNKMYVRAAFTNHSSGDRKNGESIEASTTFSVMRLRIVDGHYNEMLRYEPTASVFAINGTEITQDTNNFLNDN